ncbi:unnamed protein product [Cochlearia groenlandica]
MIQRASPFNKRRKISALNDFRHGRVTHESIKNLPRKNCGSDVVVTDQKYHYSSEANGGNVGSGSCGWGKRNLPQSCGSKVKPLSSEESVRLITSQRIKRRSRQVFDSSANNHRKLLLPKAVMKQRNSPEKNKKLSNATTTLLKVESTHHRQARNMDQRGAHKQELVPVTRKRNHNTKPLSPRERVLKTLRVFKVVFKELDRDKAARRGETKTATSRIDYDTRTVLVSQGMQVNVLKMIGPVPGIEVGDEFQFKSELNLIGLHFDILGGIDYVNKEGTKLATSIVSAEGNGYMDRFDSEVMIYSGQGGGNVASKGQKAKIEDQKLVTGNLALANSMKAKTPVRVIRGEKRVDQRGKRYVYVGLYLVQDYWREKGPLGNVVFKFKLRRVSGQPSV